MDELKKYLYENRDGLDVEKAPRPQVWQHILQHAPAPKKNNTRRALAWLSAASIVVFAGMGIYYYRLNLPATNEVVSSVETVQHPEPEGRMDSSSITYSPSASETANMDDTAENQYEETVHPANAEKKKKRPAKTKDQKLVESLDQNYSPIIASQLKKVESTPIYAESPEYFNDLKKQWQDLEKDEKKVKEDVVAVGLSDNVIVQLMRIYQQKLLLLKQLQHEINKMNNQVKKYPMFQEKEPSYIKM